MSQWRTRSQRLTENYGGGSAPDFHGIPFLGGNAPICFVAAGFWAHRRLKTRSAGTKRFFTQKRNDYFRRWEASRKDDQNNGSCGGARRAVPLVCDYQGFETSRGWAPARGPYVFSRLLSPDLLSFYAYFAVETTVFPPLPGLGKTGTARRAPTGKRRENRQKIIVFEQSVYDRVSVFFRVDCSPPRERRTPARQCVFDPASMTRTIVFKTRPDTATPR